MTLAELLPQRASQGVRLRAADDRLKIDAPAGWMTDSYRREIVRHKPGIFRWLAARAMLEDAIADADGVLDGWHRADRIGALRDAARQVAGYALDALAAALDGGNPDRVASAEAYAAFVAGRIRRHARDERTP